MKQLVSCAIVLLTSSSVQAGTFFTISSVTNTNSTNFFPVTNLIQGSEFGFDSAEPHNQRGTGGINHTWVTNDNGGDWFSGNLPNPVVVFDLGDNVSLIEISTWGYANDNTNGLKDFSLRFATDSDGTTGFGTSISYNPSFEASFSYTVRDSNLFPEPVTARYVEMTMMDNWGGLVGNIPGGDRVGLGEVAFENVSIPEPSTAFLSLIAGFGLLGRRR
ncbi:PEP-CTERM sorting domain-containing protein [Verrucomicrobiaceae bacterium 227]